MFEKIARFSVRFRWLVIIFWIAMVPVVTNNFPKLADVTKNETSDFLPKDSPTAKAIDLEATFQKKETTTSAFLVASRADGPLTPADEAAIKQVQAEVRGSKSVTEVKDEGTSADGQARQILIGINGDAFGDKAFDVVKDIRARIHRPAVPAGLQLNLAGDFAASVDAAEANQNSQNNTEMYTVIFIIVLLLLVFRSLLAPIITLIPAGLALTIAEPVIAKSTEIGVQVGFITQILLIVLVLGAGTDYGLFLVFRVREELRKGLTPKEAVIKAMGRVGESITFSAATVIAALLSLLLATFGIYKGLGPALAIGLGIMLLIALTFLPAVLAVLGRAVFWPSKTRKQTIKIGLWGKVADTAITKPFVVIGIGLVIFGGLALGSLGYKAAGFGSDTAPKGTDSAAGQTVLTEHFPSSNSNPSLFILKFEQSVWDDLTVVRRAQAELLASGQFKSLSGPFEANGFQLTPESLAERHAAAQPDDPVLLGVSQFISQDGRTVQFFGNIKGVEPGSNAAMDATPRIQASLAKVADKVGATDNAVFSGDSFSYDINRTANNDLKKIIPVVLLIIAGLLALLLRSLVAPWYLIITVGLSYLASLGFAMLVFVHLGGQDGLFFILPFLMFIFCMALGEDYNILVMSRIREEAHGDVTLLEAVTKAIGVTGTTVTSAGLILAGTFAVLGVVGGDQDVQQIGYGVAFGILLDTFFVRTLLVPSIVALLGRWNWWPSALHRR